MIKILFFGSIADTMRQRECSLSVDKNMTLEGVVHAVGCDDFKSVLVALNQEQVNDMSLMVKDGDEVAIMPPFSGG